MTDIMTKATELLTTVGVIIVALAQLRHGVKIKRIDMNSKVAAEQTANSHEHTEYPNLRDEQTAIREQVGKIEDDVKAVRGLVHGIERSVRRITSWVRDLDTVAADTEATIDRKVRVVASDLERAIADRDHALQERDAEVRRMQRELPHRVTEQVARHLSEHPNLCPLHNRPKKKE